MKHLVPIFLLSLFSHLSFAQSDFKLWNSIGLKYKVNSKLSFGLEEQLRLKENISAVDNYFTEFNAEYAILKPLEVSAAYRFTQSNDNKGKIQGYENLYRYNFDVSYKIELGRGDLKTRLRYQNGNEFNLMEDSEEEFRLLTRYAYNFRKWKLDPEFAVELFNEANTKEINKLRLTIGTSYNLKDYGEVSLFYRDQRSLNEIEPNISHIIGLGYSYTIKRKK